MNTRNIGAVIIYSVSALLVFGIFALLSQDARDSQVEHLITALPAIVAGVPGLPAYLKGKDNEQRLNGELDKRMQDNTRQVLTEFHDDGTGTHRDG